MRRGNEFVDCDSRPSNAAGSYAVNATPALMRVADSPYRRAVYTSRGPERFAFSGALGAATGD